MESLRLPPLRSYQSTVLTSCARDPVVISAPQLGKTTLARLWLLGRAYQHGPDARSWWWTSHTYSQAKHGFMGLVRHAQQAGLCKSYTTTTPLELRLEFPCGGTVVIEGRSWNDPQGMYGPTVLGGVADEFGWMTAAAYSAISSRRAETVTQGLGHFLWIGNVGNIGSEAQHIWNMAQAGEDGFECWQWTWRDRAAAFDCACGNGTPTPCDLDHARDHLPTCQRGQYLRFIASERGRMSRGQFAQLYEAEWADYNDLPAYEFDRAVHVDAERAEYDKHLPIEIACDFNVDPMAWTLGQHRGKEAWSFDEIVIPGGATTRAACEEFIRRYPATKTELVVYGDRSGKSRDTRSKQSDYDQIKIILGAHYTFTPRFEVPAANPPVSERLNAVNAKLRAADGTVSYWMHPRCVNLIEDRARVSLLPGTHDIDKRDKKRTHSSDSDDYRLARLFPVVVDAPVYVGVTGDAPFRDQFIGQRF